MIQKIEELSMNALPALSTVFVDGWILRFANGYSKRANSVNPIYPCSVNLESNVAICERLFQENNLDTVFKLTEQEEIYKLDELLSQRGYSYEAKTNIMVKNILGFKIQESEKANAFVYRELREDWFEAFITMNRINVQNAQTLRRMLQNIIPDTYYGYVMENGSITAVGLGVSERGYVGMYDICVEEDRRRQGLGTKIMNNLIDAALEDGCTYSYLQVVDANEPAKALYEKLGYEKLYSYWYRVKKKTK
ncbi:Ribosomal protein S18 acetylase RimI [Geosporobacter subterraneus DSM 17957]|uniref:Ribosomal protein S18 acetylase RimI n=1 Tax=Geosporobacter subterraneus DSM 17957 TaxID=1121919 RepID=A0A1M6KZ89_9FIRM|nr:GNAT family N-acetyltransferase [Geosporobacter subterraneus]SHJ64315.1 Ribosomal protein S18 acetylase RimI [Geosporobacter subterraneus DSM 17957]